jgi:hypothetical protein
LAVNAEEVKEAPVIAPSNCVFSDGMASTAAANTLSNPGDSEINRRQPKVDEVKGIAAVLEIFELEYGDSMRMTRTTMCHQLCGARPM